MPNAAIRSGQLGDETFEREQALEFVDLLARLVVLLASVIAIIFVVPLFVLDIRWFAILRIVR